VVGSRPVSREVGQLEFTMHSLVQVRDAVRGMLAGWDRERAADVVLAVHEVAVNSVKHGAQVGVLRMWEYRDGLIFQIENRRILNAAPVMQAPTTDQTSGRGLWLASHLVDNLTIEVTSDKAIVRLRLTRTIPTHAGRPVQFQ
jgi:anti-sigma regulatory factor (Ser/Thr protein kinase)